jgi:hypothetical protein
MHVAACQAASLIVMKYHVLCVCLLLLVPFDLTILFMYHGSILNLQTTYPRYHSKGTPRSPFLMYIYVFQRHIEITLEINSKNILSLNDQMHRGYRVSLLCSALLWMYQYMHARFLRNNSEVSRL